MKMLKCLVEVKLLKSDEMMKQWWKHSHKFIFTPPFIVLLVPEIESPSTTKKHQINNRMNLN